MKYLLFILIFILSNRLTGQLREIEGKIMDESTNEAIPFANIQNRSLRKGTISNADGFFKISFEKWTDTIWIHSVGFKSQRLTLDQRTGFYVVKMQESITELGEVMVTLNENIQLFHLLEACRTNPNKIKQQAKSYYELKTFIDDKQVELVEGFFNVGLSGYELSSQELKAGRIAMQTYDEQMRMFVSTESSKAIILSKVMNETDYFPLSPLSMNLKKMRRGFYLNLDRKYLDDNQDSITVINYLPKIRSGNYFKGKIWLNTTQNRLVKQTMECEDCKIHPFLPLFESDSILKVNLQITKTFGPKNGKQLFNHVDFNYEIAYKSRFGQSGEKNYRIKTSALLYAYDYDETFFIPKFEFDKKASDYRKIFSIPSNDFFWKYNDEYRMNDHQNSNLAFFSDPASMTNANYSVKTDSPLKKGFFQEPYIRWSTNRIIFKESIPDSLLDHSKVGLTDRNYNLSVKVFLDMNSYQDSTNILTCTIFDPYESYYLLPIDTVTHCFINIYFDLVEIERRKLEKTLKNKVLTREELNERYDEFIRMCDLIKKMYFEDVDHGRNRRQLIKWNSFVKSELQIDNIEIFGLFKEP
ncbi:carboxypeptidase-like regulatory domain-containing protein [Fluviicola chungangensis]|uniref:Carboxypeptidase-like regulatory domain-containing protein n=1 Tax=Fluviicola chungangensis TaxID=2597671 RepID=A0A556MY84_9FLAO|nr:carboxypeptidase-like regulatory domain-containing protein [Fluviicola chungangensis]TSJ44749.1 carboxypeptidase-like regulatory domain-containing protein [Fluviicola chungangensis]